MAGAASGITPVERRWTRELVYGVVRFRGRIDHLLGLHLRRRGMGDLHPDLRILLRIGAWQLIGMDSVPVYASVSETVKSVRRLRPPAGGRGAAGLANAVLRKLAEAGGGPERFPSLDDDPIGHLATWGSHPAWLIERWLPRFGPAETRALVDANNRIPRVHLRTLATGEVVTLEPGASLHDALRAHHPAQVQDPAASAVVDFFARRWGPEGASGALADVRVADLCAAPGGKGIALAALGARVIGLDPSPMRLARMKENIERLSLPVGLVVARGEAPPFRPAGTEAVLVDAPCTGTGTLARHPDARWRLDPTSPGMMAEVQDRILDGAAEIVSPGGILVYSTCTLEPEENEDRVRDFILRHPAFRVEDTLELVPHRTGTDGAFAAGLRKENDR